MPTFLKTLWNNRTLVFAGLAAVIVVCGWFYLQSLKTKIGALNEHADALAVQVDQITKAHDAYAANAQATIDAMAAHNKENEARLEKARTTERKIRNVPKDQDGGVAPVLSDSLGRMR